MRVIISAVLNRIKELENDNLGIEFSSIFKGPT